MMQNDNMFPNQAEPVQRNVAGTLPNALNELSEERLTAGDVNASVMPCYCEAEGASASIDLCYCSAEGASASIDLCYCAAEGAAASVMPCYCEAEGA